LAFGHDLPSKKVVDGRLCFSYPCLDYDWLAQGTVVFPDRDHGLPRSSWHGRVARFAGRNVRPTPDEVVIPVQVHGSRVVALAAAAGGAGRPAIRTPVCDGLVTGESRVMIGISTADCVPLTAVDEVARIVGSAHCGWRGIAGGVVRGLVREMEAAGAAPGRRGTRFVIGASIGPCCYEVGDDFLQAFGDREVAECLSRDGGRGMFDLKRLVALRLVDEGIDPAAIIIDNTCTSCAHDSLCSYRARGVTCGRMYTYAMIVERGSL